MYSIDNSRSAEEAVHRSPYGDTFSINHSAKSTAFFVLALSSIRITKEFNFNAGKVKGGGRSSVRVRGDKCVKLIFGKQVAKFSLWKIAWKVKQRLSLVG